MKKKNKAMPIWKNTVTTKLKTSMSICKNYFGPLKFHKTSYSEATKFVSLHD